MFFIKLRTFPFLCSVVVKAFSAYINLIIWRFFFSWLFCFSDGLNWFFKFGPNLHTWNKSQGDMVCKYFYISLHSVCWHFVEDFSMTHIWVKREIFIFISYNTFAFDNRIMLDLENQVRSASSVSIFWKRL